MWSEDYWKKWFPADLVLECFPGQFKNWFYSLLAMSTVLEKEAPFKTLLGHGLVKDEHGEEMHKSKGNAIWFDDAAEKMGVDPMRWLYVTQDPSHNLNFGYGPAREVKRRFLFILWNSFKYFVTYARLDNFNPNEAQPRETSGVSADLTPEVEELAGHGEESSADKQLEHFTLDTFDLHVMDRWILSRSNEAFKSAEDYLEAYQNHKAAQVLEDFVVKDLSTLYIRRIHDRVGPTAPNGEDKTNAYRTLYGVLIRLTKVLAPFIPFMTEEMYQVLVGPAKEKPAGFAEQSPGVGELAGKAKDSVHLTNWPKYKEYLTDEEVLEKMKVVRDIVEKGHAARREAGIRVRQPLAELVVKAGEGNSDMSEREFGQGGDGGVKNQYLQIIKDELNIKELKFEEGKGELEVELDTEINEDLRLEGLAREIIRNIQKARKKADCAWDDKIIATYPDTEENKAAVNDFQDYIKKQTLSTKLRPGTEYSIEVAK